MAGVGWGNPRGALSIRITGVVQGVGFRFTSERLARGLDVAGWVKNTNDGRVELACEGEESVVAGFLKKINNGLLKSYIENADVSWSDATGEFRGFEIRFNR